MNIRALGVLLLKFWGLFWLAGGLLTAANTFLLRFSAASAADAATLRFMLMSAALSAVWQIASGVALLLGAHRIVGVILPPDADADTSTAPHSLEGLQSVVFGGIGAYLAISALAKIGELAYAILRHPAWDTTNQFLAVMQDQQEVLAGAAVQLVFAIVLLVTRAGAASLWKRMRPMAQ